MIASAQPLPPTCPPGWIEPNAITAAKAITAARMALCGDGSRVIEC